MKGLVFAAIAGLMAAAIPMFALSDPAAPTGVGLVGVDGITMGSGTPHQCLARAEQNILQATGIHWGPHNCSVLTVEAPGSTGV